MIRAARHLEHFRDLRKTIQRSLFVACDGDVEAEQLLLEVVARLTPTIELLEALRQGLEKRKVFLGRRRQARRDRHASKARKKRNVRRRNLRWPMLLHRRKQSTVDEWYERVHHLVYQYRHELDPERPRCLTAPFGFQPLQDEVQADARGRSQHAVFGATGGEASKSSAVDRVDLPWLGQVSSPSESHLLRMSTRHSGAHRTAVRPARTAIHADHS